MNIEFCFSVMENKGIPVLWDSEEMIEQFDNDFLLYQLYLIWIKFKGMYLCATATAGYSVLLIKIFWYLRPCTVRSGTER